VLIDGAATVTQDSLRSHIGMVTQECVFATSLRDNITYRPSATDAISTCDR
jgi:ABC-type multidrug transport system fused ATPase/permease subunit